MAGIGHNAPPDEAGWIAISRAIIDHHIVGAGQPVEAADRNKGSFSRLESWLDLITLANWAERKIDNLGVVTILQPGQTLAGRSFLARRWNWSEKTVRAWLIKLEKELMITLFCESAKANCGGQMNDAAASKQGQPKGHTRNVLTICNWEKYQRGYVDQGPPSGPAKGHPGATQGPQKNKGTIKQEEVREEEGGFALAALAADAAPSPAAEALSAFEAYNDLALRLGWPAARSLTPARRRSMQARLREHGGLDAWRTVLANIERSAFLQGQNDRGWRPPGLDWFLTPANFVKVLEGNYGNGAHAKPKESQIERLFRLGAEATEELEASRRERLT